MNDKDLFIFVQKVFDKGARPPTPVTRSMVRTRQREGETEGSVNNKITRSCVLNRLPNNKRQGVQQQENG